MPILPREELRQDHDLAQFLARSPEPLHLLEVLSGGYSTLNVRVCTATDEPAVLRWRPGDARTLDTELAAAAHVAARVEVPRVLERGEDWALLSWVEGRRVDALLEDEALREEWEPLGRALAAVHAPPFERAGFFHHEEVFEAIARLEARRG